MSEEERVRQISQTVNKTNDEANRLVYDDATRSFRPSSCFADPDKAIPLTEADGDLFTD